VSDPGFWDKLKRGLKRTHGEWLERVDAAVSGRGAFDFDEEIVEHLEEALIAADLGVETALELVENVRSRATRADAIDVVKLRQMLVDEMAILLLDAPRPREMGDEPRVTLIVGVNGAGKTTSAAKLARWSEARGEKALLVAADTFRAAAVEQLSLWGERLGVGVIRQPTGSDAAALVFDALQAARARKVRHLIIDTAGRLHNKEHLMAELGKIRRVIDREGEGFSRRSLLVLDATTGQNAIAQAREFSRVAAIDGVLLAKLDGTAKGGMAVAIARDLELPILFLGVGEGADDLIEFRPREFAAALLG
jgi:fused signal recognition particle receptor